jgi:trehalose-phosphatase
VKHLFRSWSQIQAKVDRAGKSFLFFDYDGTLTPIVSRRELALCPPEMKNLLARLRDLPRASVAIISGRSLEDLYGLIGVPGITYVGNHGLEIRNPAGIHRKNLSAGRQKEMAALADSLKKALGKLPGILFADKGVTLAVHYRMVSETCQERVSREIDEVARKWGDHWRVTRVKMVFEAQPRLDFDKGKAVDNLIKAGPAPGLLTFYFGDDRTDEDAFSFLRGKGITVFVGPPSGPSGAEFFLETPAEVKEFIRRFIAAWPREAGGLSAGASGPFRPTPFITTPTAFSCGTNISPDPTRTILPPGPPFRCGTGFWEKNSGFSTLKSSRTWSPCGRRSPPSSKTTLPISRLSPG